MNPPHLQRQPPPPPRLTCAPATSPPVTRPVARPALKRTVGVARGMVPARSAKRWYSAVKAASGIGLAALCCGSGWLLISTVMALARYGRSGTVAGCDRARTWDALVLLIGSFLALLGPAAYLAARPGDDKTLSRLAIGLLALPAPAVGVRTLSAGCAPPPSDRQRQLVLAWTLLLGPAAVWQVVSSLCRLWKDRNQRLSSVDPSLPSKVEAGLAEPPGGRQPGEEC